MYAQTTHSTLIARLAAATDDGAWREFCVRYGDLIHNVARHRGLQPTDGDDVLQDVLLALRKAMPNFRYDRSRGTFRGYLKTVTLHAIYARSRQKRGESPLPDWRAASEPSGDDAFDAVWEAQWRQYHLRQAMRTIEVEFNEPDRIAFARYGVDGEPVREVARELGLSVDQVYQAKSRILKRLTTLIAEQVAEEG